MRPDAKDAAYLLDMVEHARGVSQGAMPTIRSGTGGLVLPWLRTLYTSPSK